MSAVVGASEKRDSKTSEEVHQLNASSATQLSYHICDFIVTDTGQIILLELGNAIHLSNFEGRRTHNGVHVEKEILKHARTKAFITERWPVLRSQLHMRAIQRYFADDDCARLNGGDKSSKEQMELVSPSTRHHYHLELTQELRAKNAFLKNNLMVLDGAVDMLFVCDRNKRLLHSFLSLNNLQKYQPRTWYYNTQSFEPFNVPPGISYFVIKESNGSLAEGTFLCPVKDILTVLNAIKLKSPKLAPGYEPIVLHYCAEDGYANVIIQEFCPGRKIDGYQATARAVFAVYKTGASHNLVVKAEIIDMFWQLALKPAVSAEPVYEEYISAKGYQQPKHNCWPSMSVLDHSNIEKQLLPILEEIANTAYRKMDIKEYLLTLYRNNRMEDLDYYLSFYPHIRIDRLNETLCNLLISVESGKLFLLEQAQYYALPFHLNFPQRDLRKWLVHNIEVYQETPALLYNLLSFLREQLNNIKDLKEIKALALEDKYQAYVAFTEQFISRIVEILLANVQAKTVTNIAPNVKAVAATTAATTAALHLATATKTAEAVGTAPHATAVTPSASSCHQMLLKALAELEAIELGIYQKEALTRAKEAIAAAVTQSVADSVASNTVVVAATGSATEIGSSTKIAVSIRDITVTEPAGATPGAMPAASLAGTVNQFTPLLTEQMAAASKVTLASAQAGAGGNILPASPATPATSVAVNAFVSISANT